MKKIIPYLFVSLIFFSCNNDKNGRLLLPSVNGKAGEVLLILEDDLWKDTLGAIFKDALLASTPSLPQDEPLFDISRVPNAGFSKFMQAARNIIKVNIGDNMKTAIDFRKDVWAEPQLVIRLQAPNKEELLNLLQKNKDRIVNQLLEAERRRNLAIATKYEAVEIERKLKSNYNIKMVIPKDYQLFDEKKDFVWLKKDTRDYMMGIFIYSFEYNSPKNFSVDYLIQKRDSVLKINVPGERKGSYMTTEHRVEPYFVNIEFQKKQFVEIRSLWDVVNDAMGGPFISYSTLDVARNRVVTVEGFVYYPNFNKRDLIRQLQAILLTIEFEK